MRIGFIFLFLSSSFLSYSQSNDSSYFKIGGAVRFNTMYTIYEGNSSPLPTENRNGVFWDVLRLEVNAMVKGLGFEFEYRVYPGFNSHFLKKGFLSYGFKNDGKLEIGITQKPFGRLEYLGNSWWFQLPYYVGLEDDYDTGIKYGQTNGKFSWKVAYFLMAEPRGQSDPAYGSYMSARYSYDVIPSGDGYSGNKERNQLNLWGQYDFTPKINAGLSFEIGQIYNSVSEKASPHYAAAIHGEFQLNKRMNIKSQITYYNYPRVVNDQGVEETPYVNMGAYGFGTYQVASEASMFSAGLSYLIPIDWGPIESITLYEDYTYMLKSGSVEIEGDKFDFINSQHNVVGFLVSASYVYAYFDIASGINQPWLGEGFGGAALSAGRGENPLVAPGEDIDTPEGSMVNPLDQSPPWNTRFNINIGAYF